MHYWGEHYLRLIAGMLGLVIRLDKATLNKDRMQYARVLVESNTIGPFFETTAFTNEDEELVRVNLNMIGNLHIVKTVSS